MLTNTVICIQQNDRNTYCTEHPQAEGNSELRLLLKQAQKAEKNEMKHKTVNGENRGGLKESLKTILMFLSKSALYFHFCKAAAVAIFFSPLFALRATHLTFCLYLCFSQSVTGSFLALLSPPSPHHLYHTQTLSWCFIVRLPLIKRTSRRPQLQSALKIAH